MRRRLFGVSVFLVTSLAVGSGVGGRTEAASGGSISGVVYFDTDMDGQRDAGEPPAPGRTVRLTEYTEGESNPETLVKSGPDGNYRFEHLSSDSVYNLGVLTDSETPCASGDYRNLQPGMAWSGQDLGVLSPGNLSLSGVVVDDLNGNGVRDAGEPGLEDRTVSLQDQGGPIGVSCGLTTESGSDGRFSFKNLPPFKYEFVIEAPPSQAGLSWVWTFPTKLSPGSPFADSRYLDNVVDLTQVRDSAYLEAGQHLIAGSAAIAGTVFVDADIDGIRDAGEQTVDCLIIRGFLQSYWHVPSLGTFSLGLGNDAIPCENGEFEIDGLEAGTYIVGMPWCGVPGSEEHRLQGPSQRSVTLADGQRVEGVDLAVCPVEWPTPSPPVPTGVVTPLAPTPSPQPGNTPASIGLVGAPDTGSGGASDTAGRGSVLAALLAIAAVGGLAAGSAFAARTRRR